MVAQVAECIAGDAEGVYYRHSRAANREPVFAKPGDSLPDIEGEGEWFPLASDNSPSGEVPLVLGTGLMMITGARPEVIKVRGELNVLYTATVGAYQTGRYRLTGIVPMSWGGKEGFHAGIERVGDIDPKDVVYLAGLANI